VQASVRAGKRNIGRLNFVRQAARQTGILIASLLAGLAVGVAYRFLFDPTDKRDVATFLRSGLQNAGVALTVLAVQTGFASGARSQFGSVLRRLPLAGELVVRAAVMAVAVIVVNLTLQFLLYW
jgi:hypothetical protein